MTRAKASPLLTTRYGIAAPNASDTPAARALQLYGEWAEQETDLLSGVVTDGHHVLEVGGDHAAHTLWLALAVGDTGAVHVVEPRRLPFQQLCANIALNQLANVHTHHAYLGANDGNEGLASETTRRIRLDSLALPALHLLKVNIPDVLEDLLKGAGATLVEHRPLVYARLGGPASAEREVDAVKAWAIGSGRTHPPCSTQITTRGSPATCFRACSAATSLRRTPRAAWISTR